MNIEAVINGLIIAGAALFVLAYHFRNKRSVAGDRDPISSWPLYEWIDRYLKLSSILVTLAAVNFHHPLLLQIHDQLPIRLLGLGLAGFALALFAAAMWTLDTNYTPAHDSYLPGNVVRTGPYRLIRHPIYTSNLILLVALFLVSGSLWLIVNLAILVTYYVPTILREESAIEDRFPEYGDYVKRTGRFFPKLGRKR